MSPGVSPHQAAILLAGGGALAWVLSVAVASKETEQVKVTDLAIAAIPIAIGIGAGYYWLTRSDK